jgi:hypothetical protein
MKISSWILTIISCLFVLYLLAADLQLKKQYDQIDKTDPYWNYTKLANGSFHHLRITGANMTRIAFNPSPHGSIGVLNDEYWLKERLKTYISNDTLFLLVEPGQDPANMREWMKSHVLITISCPDLLSVNVENTNLELFKMKQKTMNISLSGKSRLELESVYQDFDSIFIHQRDSTQVVFEMEEDIKSSGTMHVNTLYADVRGYSILDIGHFQIGSLHQTIGDTAAIVLSGYTLRQIK